MAVANLARSTTTAATPDALFARIGQFLAANHLSADPINYAFAFRVVSDPGSVLARAVDALTDGGFRLTQQDVESLGGQVVAGPSASSNTDSPASDAPAPADALLARAQIQVDGFVDAMRSMQMHTSGFGRDLEASTAAMRSVGARADPEQIMAIAATMLDRVRRAEGQLEDLTAETDALRSALDDARGAARTDPLTALANRRAFDEAYGAVGLDETVVVAICDIDHFKRVNDEFGHNVGDRILSAIGRALSDHCEPHLVSRYGGEEFALLFRGVDAGEALTMLNAARESVASRRFRSRDTGALIGTVTFSCGICEAHAATREEALHCADNALYAAKRQGRNLVIDARTLGA